MLKFRLEHNRLECMAIGSKQRQPRWTTGQHMVLSHSWPSHSRAGTTTSQWTTFLPRLGYSRKYIGWNFIILAQPAKIKRDFRRPSTSVRSRSRNEERFTYEFIGIETWQPFTGTTVKACIFYLPQLGPLRQAWRSRVDRGRKFFLWKHPPCNRSILLTWGVLTSKIKCESYTPPTSWRRNGGCVSFGGDSTLPLQTHTFSIARLVSGWEWNPSLTKRSNMLLPCTSSAYHADLLLYTGSHYVLTTTVPPFKGDAIIDVHHLH
jgi:hypothetical protein